MKKTITQSFLSTSLNNKFKMLAVAATLIVGGIQAQNLVTLTTPGAGTFTVPANVATMTVECWGAGGAGGSCENGTTAAQTRGGGGAGGSYSKLTIASPSAGDYAYTIGAGGVASPQPVTNLSFGGNGGSTTFGSSLVVALGGPGGQNVYATTTTSGTGGQAPTSGNTPDGGAFYGGNGGNAGAGSGAGGGSAGSSGNGGAGGVLTTVGAAGAGGGVAGGSGTNLTATLGAAGSTPGAGGGGSCVRASANTYRVGGAGGNGQIKISYTLVAASSTVEMTAPTNKTVVAIGSSVQLSATIVLYSGRTFSSIVFKDGTETISGTITNVGDVYSITYNNVPSGKRNITAELTDNTETVISPISIIYGGPITFTGNKYAQSAITWNAGPWYDDPTDGQVVTAPTGGDNVFTQGNAVTILEDATCDNLTFTNALGQIGIAADKTLKVLGKVDCSTVGTFDAFSISNPTSTLKLTGSILTTPFVLVTENATSGMRPNKVIIDPFTLTNTYQWGTGTGVYFHGSGAFIVAAGTQLTFKNSMYLGDGVNNHFQVGAGAVITMEKQVRGPANLFSRITKATIDGSLIAKDNFIVKELILGTDGKITTWKSTNANSTYPTLVTCDGWWGHGNSETSVSSFGTPTVLTFGSNSTIEFGLAGNQNVNGIVPANGTAPAEQYSIPYTNLKLSGSGIKTVQSNMVVSKNLDIAAEVTLSIPTGKVVVNTGTVTGTAPVPAGALITAYSNDNAKGTVSATIAAGEVTLVAAPITGFMFDKWTEGATELSTLASYTFTPADAENKVIVANFVVDTNTGSATTTKANAYITVIGKNLQVIGEVNAIEIYNAQGKQIQKLSKVNHVNGLTTGIYIVKMHTAQGVNIQKVSIK